MDSTRKLFLYWVGKEYKLISILRNLIYLHSTNGKGYKIHLINSANIKDYIENIPSYFNKLQPEHQADFVRVHVICKFGGLWLDSDTLVLDGLDSLFDIIENKNGFFIKENNEILCNNIFGSKPNTELMLLWKNKILEILDSRQENTGWSEIGSIMLQNMYNSNKQLYNNYEIFNGLDNLYPVNRNKCLEEYIKSPYEKYTNIIRNYQPLIVLVNSVYKELEIMTEEQILNGNMPLNYFINKSFENKGIQKNKLYTNQYIFNYGQKDYISNSILVYRCWEPNISNIFNNILENNGAAKNIIIDIGCNIGYYSILCSKNKSVSEIYSIDANNDNIHMLKMSCYLNRSDNIKIINTCISDKSDILYKCINKDFATSVNNIGGFAYAKTIDNNTNDNIKSITIDDLIKNYNIENVTIMKIDIEGGELNALKGAVQTLQTNKIKNIIIEISPKFNNDGIEILELLKYNGYDMFNIPHCEIGNYNNDTNFLNIVCNHKINNIENFINTIPIQTNILAIKNEQIQKYVVYTDWIETYLTKESFLFSKRLELFGWKIIKLSNLNIDYIKSNKCIVLCVTYDDFDISLIKCDNVNIIYKIDDLYPYKEIRNKCIENANLIISPYQYLFNTNEVKNMYKNINNIKSFHIPYSSVDDFFYNICFNDNPIHKIFISGNTNHVYPVRQFIKTDPRFSAYIESLDHPSYYNYSHNIINEEYYKKLNKYLCCYTDASIYKYVLLKIFEICSVGSLLLVDDSISEELNNLGFYNNINCIFCNKNNVEDKIKWILNIENRNLVDNIRKSGMELVRVNHTTTKRIEQFINIISNNN